ncbi:hypothetical protein EDD80_1257 [Anseongella ginsenosidimutans]|uniref:Competence protein CoiA-like protein n=1 Tax=Anseongella ginsenosidimutans TaxID=496056 RepID=A0A4R3KKT9_9SPHI|nr:hypothetical protein [Anseongella ginsenosidimutans]QEC53626.1 hypothetical protein FRZ59_15635 [Anseongella ginsenosidimutans]TCS83916.1 hypothetical protein EDD80_1257 [Anseongella ginsenosidimutans]
MIQYQHAIGFNGEVINIGDVTLETRHVQQFSCIGCGAKMTAVLGKIRAHHFRHSGDSCSWESYLHQLGKLILQQRFDSAREFPVKYYVRNGCPHFLECRLREDHAWGRCPPVELRTIDLKQYYDTCEVEATYQGFKADLMLTSSEHPEWKPVFLEVAVSHNCEQNKIDSGIRIIEMDVQSESDVVRDIVESHGEWLLQASGSYHTPDVPAVRFYNFKRAYEPRYLLDRFYLFIDERGMYRAGLKRNAVHCYDVETKHEENSCFEVTLSADYRPSNQQVSLYALGMALAIQKGYDINNCTFCSHYSRCSLPFEFIDKPSGKYYYKWIANKSIPPSKLDKWLQAVNCSKYHISRRLCQKIIDSCKGLPYLEWSKD